MSGVTAGVGSSDSSPTDKDRRRLSPPSPFLNWTLTPSAYGGTLELLERRAWCGEPVDSPASVHGV
jgi:hypothetical protein